MKKVNLKIMGLDHFETLTVFGDKNIIKDIKKTDDGLLVKTNNPGNIVLWIKGWLYQSKPRTPENGCKAHCWQPISEKELVSHELVNPLDWKAWQVA